MTWLFDLGNTRLKWARLHDAALSEPGALAHEQPDFAAQLNQALSTARPGDSGYLSNVTSPELRDRIEGLLGARGIVTQRIGPPRHLAGLRLAYAEPQALGVDRWLALLAAQARGATGYAVASCGSALTLDAVTGDGRHLGGLIVPSPTRSREALFARATHLRGGSGRVAWFNGNTADAVESGAVLAAVALIDRFVEAAGIQMAQSPVLLLTGGGANELRPHLRTPVVAAPWLVLEGIVRWLSATSAVEPG